ncbi:ABC transporter permease [Pontiella agarivorans]|uniref:ABC transporter permease n=1 Tax=Pontiella agarivorans TaxID=3038953 RepID=A0ABU5MZT3_9BACT|nr:ABC transporter permease [Pontiella agarivorans]MDZ8119724.1 ABC transporter permease [Pontiella agarivorans]
MKLPISLFLAVKYLKPKRSMVSFITILTMCGIMLGVAILIVVLSVMTGFDDVHKEHMIKLDSHIQVSTRGNSTFYAQPVLEVLSEMPEIKAAAPAVEGFVMMTRYGQAITAVLRGVEPELEKEISDIESYLVEGELPLEEETVVVGSRLAMQLGVGIGDTITVYSPECFVSEDELRLPAELTVVGIFSVDMYEIDSQFMISSLPTARDVFALEEGVETLRLITEDPFTVDETGRKIREKLGEAMLADDSLNWFRFLTTRSWVEIHQNMLSTLAVEKNMMFLLLIAISVVAAFCVSINLINMGIQKTHEIGLLKAVGFSSGKIVGIFLFLGIVQGVLGCVLGSALGIWFSGNLDAILEFLRRFNPNLMSAEFYQFSQMPSRTTSEDVVLVCIIVMVFSILAGVLPAIRAALMQPVDALRYE